MVAVFPRFEVGATTDKDWFAKPVDFALFLALLGQIGGELRGPWLLLLRAPGLRVEASAKVSFRFVP
jgi:hypothetical protein